MLNIFTNQKVRSRMQSGPMSPYLPEIAAVLSSRVTPGAPFACICAL
jgi:hypothetical protein